MGKRGLSLIEGILAMFIFFLALALVYGVFPGCHRAADLGLRHTVARQLAQEFLTIEQARAFDQVRDDGPLDLAVPIVRNGVKSNLHYQVTIEVEDVTVRVKSVLVTVEWEQDRKVRLEGVVADI